jgi:hypothetical protein
MSNNEVALNAGKARQHIAKITELVDNIASATSAYKAILETEVDRTNIVWMKSLVAEATKLAEVIQRNQGALSDVQDSLTRYSNEVNEYSEDTTGL